MVLTCHSGVPSSSPAHGKSLWVTLVGRGSDSTLNCRSNSALNDL